MEEHLSINQFNDLFKSLYGFRSKYQRNLIEISKKSSDGGYYEIYSIKEGFVKITLMYDSYGYGEYITGVEFVEEKHLTLTEYK